ncbi:hypothetical protein JY96_16170 [Aquabacterium sp. NJ1]|nr:hypothetical protein JY96_16170 [Aquabacterium sp. NJ1]
MFGQVWAVVLRVIVSDLICVGSRGLEDYVAIQAMLVFKTVFAYVVKSIATSCPVLYFGRLAERAAIESLQF